MVMNENITMEMLIRDWNISQSEINEEVKRDDLEKEGNLFYKDRNCTLEEKEFYAVRSIARLRIDKLNEKIGKKMQIFKTIHYIVPVVTFILWALIIFCVVALMVIMNFLSVDAAFILAWIIMSMGVILGAKSMFAYDEFMFKKLNEKYPWWYRRGGLYFDSIGQYYGEEMPAT